MEGNIIVRKAKVEDRGFIMKHWLLGQYYGDPHFTQMGETAYNKYFTNIMRKIILSPATHINVACFDDAEDMAFGFAVYKFDTLYWVFVKPDYRGDGIMNLMLEKVMIKNAASTSKSGAAIIKKKRWNYNPFLLEENV